MCSSSTGFPKSHYFLFSQRAKLARFNIQGNATVACALDLLHMMANLFKHAADLAILALRQGDFIPRIVRLAHQTHLRGRRAYRSQAFRSGLAANADSLTQLLNVIFLRQPCHLHQICFGNVRSGLGEEVGQLTVVRHEQQAFTGIIKAADRIYALAHVLDQTHHRGPAFRIGDRGHISLRLIEQKVDMLFRTVQQLAIDLDVVGGEIGLGAEFGNDLSVDGDATLRNQFFSFAARGYSGGGNDFL